MQCNVRKTWVLLLKGRDKVFQELTFFASFKSIGADDSECLHNDNIVENDDGDVHQYCEDDDDSEDDDEDQT